MKTSRWASALSALVLVLGTRRAAGQAKGSNDMAERVNKPVVYQVEGMDRVRVRKDLVYSPRRGLVAFTVPLFAAYMREHHSLASFDE